MNEQVAGQLTLFQQRLPSALSRAGNQKGKEDDRYLWPEMSELSGELTPRWVIGENVLNPANCRENSL